MSLKILHETGVIVKTLTFDGAASNIAMAKSLGANLMSQIDQVIYSSQMSHTIAKVICQYKYDIILILARLNIQPFEIE